MSEQSVIGVYNTMAEAEDAVRMLDKANSQSNRFPSLRKTCRA